MDNRIGINPINSSLRCTADNLTGAATPEYKIATIRAIRPEEKIYRSLKDLPSAKRDELVKGYYYKVVGEVILLFINVPFRIVGDVAKVLEENYNEFWQKMDEINREELSQRMLNPPPFVDLEQRSLENQENLP